MSSLTGQTNHDRDTAEQLARCVATMVYYQADGWSWSAAQLLWEQARTLTAWASEAPRQGEPGIRVLTPLQAELKARYGTDVGDRLHQEFLRALRESSEV